jgi:hypothetical protein
VAVCSAVPVSCRNEQDYVLNDNHPHPGGGRRPPAWTKKVRSSRPASSTNNK